MILRRQILCDWALDCNENPKTAQGFDHSLWEGHYPARNVGLLKEISYIFAKDNETTCVWAS